MPPENEKELILKNLIEIADMLVSTFGRNCEVAVHDLTILQKSLVYIAGTITKRKPGAPITDLVIKALHKEGNKVNNITNYRSQTKNGRILKSSTSFSRNSKGEVVGALCVNYDVTDFLNSVATIEGFVQDDQHKNKEHTETYASSPNETISALFEEGISEIGRQASTMSTEERVNLIQILEDKGVFLIKGSVDQVALSMGISKYTVYSHLREIRKIRQNNVL